MPRITSSNPLFNPFSYKRKCIDANHYYSPSGHKDRQPDQEPNRIRREIKKKLRYSNPLSLL
jgi:hypothetical protein